MSSTRAAYYGDKPVLGAATLPAAVPDQVALTAAAAAASPPTKTEFDKVVADAVAARTTLNALLASLRAAGLLHT